MPKLKKKSNSCFLGRLPNQCSGSYSWSCLARYADLLVLGTRMASILSPCVNKHMPWSLNHLSGLSNTSLYIQGFAFYLFVILNQNDVLTFYFDLYSEFETVSKASWFWNLPLQRTELDFKSLCEWIISFIVLISKVLSE